MHVFAEQQTMQCAMHSWCDLYCTCPLVRSTVEYLARTHFRGTSIMKSKLGTPLVVRTCGYVQHWRSMQAGLRTVWH